MTHPRLRPLRGQALIEMLPADDRSQGGIFIPQVARQEPNSEHGRARFVDPRGSPVHGYVRAIGPWPQVKRGKHKGFQVMPEFKVGDRVIVNAHAGFKLERRFGGQFRLVEQLAVLAVIKENGEP